MKATGRLFARMLAGKTTKKPSAVSMGSLVVTSLQAQPRFLRKLAVPAQAWLALAPLQHLHQKTLIVTSMTATKGIYLQPAGQTTSRS